MHIAYCTLGGLLNNDILRNRQVSYLFPGSGWLTVLYQIAETLGIHVASMDVALDNVAKGLWRAKDILVFQDMDSHEAKPLLDAGAVPYLIMCGESPLYAPYFHDNIEAVSAGFRFRYGFGFAEVGQSDEETSGLQKFRFPAYYQGDVVALGQPDDWLRRNEVALVAANKFKSNKLYYPTGASVVDLLRRVKWLGWRITSPSYANALKSCLHEDRLEAIAHFSQYDPVHLYGSGWGDMRGLPLYWSRRLTSEERIEDHGRCDNKLSALSGYKFSICYENIAKRGYITEKIVDCFAAGVVPIYLGAPDIVEYIPQNTFISARNNSLETISHQMKIMRADEALHMVDCGREYLRSEQGALHSYEGFAATILKLVQQC